MGCTIHFRRFEDMIYPLEIISPNLLTVIFLTSTFDDDLSTDNKILINFWQSPNKIFSREWSVSLLLVISGLSVLRWSSSLKLCTLGVNEFQLSRVFFFIFPVLFFALYVNQLNA